MKRTRRSSEWIDEVKQHNTRPTPPPAAKPALQNHEETFQPALHPSHHLRRSISRSNTARTAAATSPLTTSPSNHLSAAQLPAQPVHRISQVSLNYFLLWTRSQPVGGGSRLCSDDDFINSSFKTDRRGSRAVYLVEWLILFWFELFTFEFSIPILRMIC